MGLEDCEGASRVVWGSTESRGHDTNHDYTSYPNHDYTS